MPGLEVYPFKFRHPLTGKWVRARHKLQVPALQRRYADWRAGDTARTPASTEPYSPFRSPGSTAGN